MRLFVAAEPPEAALAELDAVVAPLRAAAPELRWTGLGSWHLTLAFLGEVDEGLMPELSTRLERAAHRHPPQRLAIAGGGAFPSLRRAQVLWAGIAGDDRAMGSLASSATAAARRAGVFVAEQHRKYRPHLTLARCRSPADVSELASVLMEFSGSSWIASTIHLIRSYLSTGPPVYEELGAWPLAAAGPTGRRSR